MYVIASAVAQAAYSLKHDWFPAKQTGDESTACDWLGAKGCLVLGERR